MIYGFIGSGKMATAIAGCLVDQGMCPAIDIVASSPPGDPSHDAFRASFPPGSVHMTHDNTEVLAKADLTVLAVKPQNIDEVMAGIREVSANKLILSIAAGVTLAKLEGGLHPTARIVRCMPNTPMLVGEGASAYALGTNATDEDAEKVHALLEAGGFACRVEESDLDAVTALSGSGPAYVFHFIEGLIEGGIALGLKPDLARALALKTVSGSVELVETTGEAPGELAAKVKSPGGTTIAACDVLEAGDFNGLIPRAMAAAHRRAEELDRGEA